MGQRIWFAEFCGKNLTRKSIFDMPQSTTKFGDNYGALLLYCGLNNINGPGELPFANYPETYAGIGGDEKGTYLAVGGTFAYRNRGISLGLQLRTVAVRRQYPGRRPHHRRQHGTAYQRAQGHYNTLQPREKDHLRFNFGYLNPTDAAHIAQHIEHILERWNRQNRGWSRHGGRIQKAQENQQQIHGRFVHPLFGQYNVRRAGQRARGVRMQRFFCCAGQGAAHIIGRAVAHKEQAADGQNQERNNLDRSNEALPFGAGFHLDHGQGREQKNYM